MLQHILNVDKLKISDMRLRSFKAKNYNKYITINYILTFEVCLIIFIYFSKTLLNI